MTQKVLFKFPCEDVYNAYIGHTVTVTVCKQTENRKHSLSINYAIMPHKKTADIFKVPLHIWGPVMSCLTVHIYITVHSKRKKQVIWYLS